MGSSLYMSEVPTQTWKGQLTFPRDYFLRSYNDRFYVGSKPNYDFGLRYLFSGDAYVYDYNYMQSKTIKELNDNIRTFLQTHDDLVRLWIVFNKPIGVKEFGLRVKSDYKSKYTEIGFKGASTIYMNRTNSGDVGFHDKFGHLQGLNTDYKTVENRQVILEVIIDKSSVEAFFFDGMYSMTNLIYPDESQRGIEIFPDNDERITIDELFITVLKPAVPFTGNVRDEVKKDIIQ